MGFEPTIKAFEGAKTVHALDRAATLLSNGSCLFAYLEVVAQQQVVHATIHKIIWLLYCGISASCNSC
jgi:hypothetical protein